MPPMQARKGGGAGKQREMLSSVVARLEEELRVKQQQLAQETSYNTTARARIMLLGAFTEARVAFEYQLAATHGPEDVRSAAKLELDQSLKRLDELVLGIRRLLHGADCLPQSGDDGTRVWGPASAGRGSLSRAEGAASAAPGMPAPRAEVAAGGEAGPSSSCVSGGAASSILSDLSGNQGDTFPATCGSGMVLWKLPSETIPTVVESMSLHMESDEFMPWWVSNIGELSVIMTQYQIGIKTPDELEKFLWTMAYPFGGLFISKPWFAQMMARNLETGEAQTSPPGHWARVAEAMALTPQQLPMLEACFKWVRSAHAPLRAECERLAKQAAEASTVGDLHQHDEILEQLAKVQTSYRVMQVAFKLVIMATVMRPDQLAQLYIMAFPFMPLLTAVLEDLTTATHE